MREQVRAQNKETLLDIINNTELSEAAKADAINSMIALTETAQKECDAEILLEAKGFENAVVSISGDSVDVMIAASELTDAQRAQIEDIVKRKTEIAAENIIISPVGNE
jgi:stage III sporulation protein AH